MEIGPIPGIRALDAVRRGDLRAPAVFDIDAAAKPGDGSERRNDRKAAGAEENEEDDLMQDGEMESGEGKEEVRVRSVDYFA